MHSWDWKFETRDHLPQKHNLIGRGPIFTCLNRVWPSFGQKKKHDDELVWKKKNKRRKDSKKTPLRFKKKEEYIKGNTLLTAEQTNLQPRTMWLSKMVKSPRDSGYLDCSFNTKRVIVIKSVLWASAAWSIFLSPSKNPKQSKKKERRKIKLTQ